MVYELLAQLAQAIDTLTPCLRPFAVLVVDGGHLPRNLILLCFVREMTEINGDVHGEGKQLQRVLALPPV